MDEGKYAGSRRNFLARAGAATGALGAATLGLSSPAGGARRRRKRVWRLSAVEPFYNCSPAEVTNGGDCTGCNACLAHAENKLFATAKAANEHRAHAGCRCGVKKGRRISRRKWRRLFGPPSDPKRLVVDKRDPRVQQILGL